MLIVEDDHKGIIVVNNNHSSVRQRFTIAHEIGHQQLHYDGVEILHRDFISSFGINRREVEANTFAAELLMPHEEITEWVFEEAIDLIDDEKAIREKAEQLGVSFQALSIRLEQLKLFQI